MVSILAETKLYFEDLINDNWDLTPIHFAGQEFDHDGTKRWINPSYTPTSNQNSGVSEVARKVYGNLDIVCWAENDVEVMTLADAVSDFMSANVDTSKYALRGYTVEDHAWHKSDKVYVYLSFNVTSYVC